MSGYDIEVETLAGLPASPAGGSLFTVPLSELGPYSIPSAFDAFKY